MRGPRHWIPATRQTPAQVLANRAIAAAARSVEHGYLLAQFGLPYLARMIVGTGGLTGRFGDSPDYVPGTIPVSGTTYYFDSTGLAGNSGLSALAPKPISSLPTQVLNGHTFYVGAANTKYMIGAGNVLPILDAGGQGPGIFLANAGCWYTCYDNDPTSATFGQEINRYADPWYWSLFYGVFPDSTYIAKNFFTIDGGKAPGAANIPAGPGNTSGNGFDGVTLNNASADKGVKGCCFQNFQATGYKGQGGANGKLLSCIIRGITRMQDAGNDFNGNGVRWEGAFSDVTVAGCWLDNVGGDNIWAAGGVGESGLKVMNNVIRSTMPTSLYTSNHGDGVQTVGPINGLVYTKNVFDMRPSETAPAFSNNGDTTPQIICCAFRNNGTFGTPSTPAIVRDNVIFTNDTATQFQGMNNMSYDRNLTVVRTNPQSAAAYSSPPQFWDNGGTARDCVDVLIGNGHTGRTALYLGSSVRNNCLEVLA